MRWACALAFAAVAFWMYTRDQSFPYYYHTDEPSKTEQVIRGQFNFHHPLLLLVTTEALMAADGTPKHSQPVVEKGRHASALFAALSVAAMVVLAWQLGGALAGLLAGALTITHPVLFELAHYMKEDCALLVGMAWTATALVAYGRRPTLLQAVLVGLGAGLALSGKYLGGVMAGAALLGIGLTRRENGSRWTALLVAFMALAACFAAINVRGLAHIGRLSDSITEELEKVERRAEQRSEAFKCKHLSKLGTTLSVPLLLGLGYWMWRRQKERAPGAMRVLGGFVIGYFLLVSFSPKTKDRYLLPVYVFACGLGAVGIVEWTRRQSQTGKLRWAGPALAAVAVACHIPELVVHWQGFKRDDRKELTAFLKEKVPPNAGIAHDVRAHLLNGKKSGLSGYVLPNPIYAPRQRYLADVGDFAELKTRGVTHVVACEADYHSALSGAKGSKKREYYDELFEKHTLVWEREPGPLQYLHPGFRVYELK